MSKYPDENSIEFILAENGKERLEDIDTEELKGWRASLARDATKVEDAIIEAIDKINQIFKTKRAVAKELFKRGVLVERKDWLGLLHNDIQQSDLETIEYTYDVKREAED